MKKLNKDWLGIYCLILMAILSILAIGMVVYVGYKLTIMVVTLILSLFMLAV